MLFIHPLPFAQQSVSVVAEAECWDICRIQLESFVVELGLLGIVHTRVHSSPQHIEFGFGLQFYSHLDAFNGLLILVEIIVEMEESLLNEVQVAVRSTVMLRHHLVSLF